MKNLKVTVPNGNVITLVVGESNGKSEFTVSVTGNKTIEQKFNMYALALDAFQSFIVSEQD